MSNIPTKSVVAERVKLLREAADDCECEGNTLLNDAPNMGPTKERRYREEAANCVIRACALRAWADEMEQQPSEPAALPNAARSHKPGPRCDGHNCIGHPFNCYGHPYDCGCTAPTKSAVPKACPECHAPWIDGEYHTPYCSGLNGGGK